MRARKSGQLARGQSEAEDDEDLRDRSGGRVREQVQISELLERRIDGTCLFHALSPQGEHWLGVGFGVANLAC